ncbi:MAG: response regulator [Opitutaceae bacterium]
MDRHALILEDESALRDIFTELLQRRGYRVDAFASPAACPPERLAACTSDPTSPRVEVIVSDKNMPPFNGLDFLERISAEWIHHPAIAVMSGFWSEGELARAQALGFRTFSKPFTLAEFLQWLEAVERAATPERAAVP